MRYKIALTCVYESQIVHKRQVSSYAYYSKATDVYLNAQNLVSLSVTNSSSLYTCNGTGPQMFLPHPQTYPHKCSTYVWCQNGVELDTRLCASGTHFVLGQTEDKACATANATTTFCAQMRLAESCGNDTSTGEGQT